MARYLRQDNSTVLDSGLCFRRRIHVYLASLSVVVLSVTLAGCVTIGKQFPKATNGYVPKVTYNVAFDKAWGIVVRVLGENSISIASESKQTGQITTGYMEGTTSIGLFNAMYPVVIWPVYFDSAAWSTCVQSKATSPRSASSATPTTLGGSMRPPKICV